MDEQVRRIIERFELAPHPEGGYYRQVYRSDLTVRHPGVPEAFSASGAGATRPAATMIWFLLSGPEFSAFHRVRWTDEIWHFHAGTPLELHLIHADGRHESTLLGADPTLGAPACVVPAGVWQAARVSDGRGWTFCGCTVAPGFDFADFEMPAAGELIARHPGHERIIRAMTRT